MAMNRAGRADVHLDMRASSNFRAVAGSLAFVLAASTGVVACGDDDDTTGTTGVTDSPPAASGADGLELAIGDRFFEPASLAAAAGETISLTIVNDGALDHTFTVDDAAVDEVVPAGERLEVELTVPDGAGARFYCRFHPEMQGSFVVGDDTDAPAPTTVAPGGGAGYGY
jgi:plastocyanin